MGTVLNETLIMPGMVQKDKRDMVSSLIPKKWRIELWLLEPGTCGQGRDTETGADKDRVQVDRRRQDGTC